MRKALIGFAVLYAGCGHADQPVIVAFGDSLTQGYGLVEAEGFVPQMRAWLASHGADVKLVNAGVSGDTTAGGLARVAWTLTPDVDGMILALGGNDLLRGLDPADARDNIEGILQVAAEQQVEVLLVGMQAPGNYGAEYKAAFDGLYADLAGQYDTLHAESFFEGLREEGVLPPPGDLRAYLQADGIHPNGAGVQRIVTGLGPHVLSLIDRLED